MQKLRQGFSQHQCDSFKNKIASVGRTINDADVNKYLNVEEMSVEEYKRSKLFETEKTKMLNPKQVDYVRD